MSAPGSAAPLVFITGASSGIGQALAARYLQRGWRVALAARRVDALQDWCRRTAGDATLPDGRPPRWAAYGVDVRDTGQTVDAARRCLQEMGLPDVVIANAGVSHGVDTSRLEDLAVLRASYETNVFGLAATFHPFIAPMRERGRGTLVGVASVAAVRGFPGHAAYCGTKAAVVAHCESLRGELRESGVRVVTLLPGYVDTPLTARNRYAMPFRMTPEAFAVRAVRAIDRQDAWRVIPWPMAIVAYGLRRLPNALFDRLLAGRPRKHRVGE